MATAGDTLSVQCGCGKKLKAPASAVGRKAKCPACGNVLTIEAPPPPPVEEDDPLAGLYDLADAEKAAANSNQVDDSPRCPKCGASLAPGAVLCVGCGYDFRSKSKVTTTKAPAIGYESKPAKGKAAGAVAGNEERAPAEGNFFLGIAFGVLFAMGGAIAYGVLSYFVGEIPFLGRVAGWTVLGVGYLAGLGVDKGYKGGNVFAGITAASITLVVVLITKFLILAALIAPSVKKAIADASSDRDDERVTEMVRDEAMKKDGLSPHAADEDQVDTYGEAADKRIAKMTDAEYQSYVRKAPAYEEREMLFEHVQADILKQKGIEQDKLTRPQEIIADKEAETKIAAMSDAEVHQKLLAADAQAAQELKAKMAEATKNHKSSAGADSESGSGISGSVLGFGIILGLIFFVWLMLPTIIAMGVAYKVAANA